MNDEVMDYESWKRANPGFSQFDYLHAFFRLTKNASDIFNSFFRLLWPEFIIRDGHLFLQDNFAEKKYKDLINKGYPRKDVEYWMNLLNLSGMVLQNDSIKESWTKEVGNQLVAIWNAKILLEFPDRKVVVSCIFDEADGEYFLVLFQNENG